MDPSQIVQMSPLIQLVPLLVLILLIIPPYIIILKKAGYSGWWGLLFLVPFANLITLWVFALSNWPNLRDR